MKTLITETEAREIFEPMFKRKENQNRHVKINGKTYEYCTALNRLSEIKNQGGYDVAIQVGFYMSGKLVLVTY